MHRRLKILLNNPSLKEEISGTQKIRRPKKRKIPPIKNNKNSA